MPVDYSKWDNLDDDSDDEQERSQAAAQQQQSAELQKQMQKQAEEQQRQQAEADSLTAAIDAAAMASSVGNYEALDAMMAQAQSAAPLDPEMEAVLNTLPEAARIAARASATAAAAAGPVTGQGGKKEPTLAELLKAQNISVSGDDDPGLEDVREFFETADEAAAAEKRLAEAEERARAAAAAAAVGAVASGSGPKMLDPSRIEEL